MSTAILMLSETSELQRIHNKWLNTRACGLPSSEDSDKLQLESFWGLFLICAIAWVFALLIYFSGMLRKFKRHSPQQSGPSRPSSSRPIRIQRFLSFVDKKKSRRRKRNESIGKWYRKVLMCKMMNHQWEFEDINRALIERSA